MWHSKQPTLARKCLLDAPHMIVEAGALFLVALDAVDAEISLS